MIFEKPRCEMVGTIEGGGYEKTYEECRRVYGTDGETPSVVTKKGGYHEVKIAIKNANQKGYEDAVDGDFVNLQYSSSSTRRGRVGKQVAQSILCTDEQAVVLEEPMAYDEQNGYVRTDGCVGTITADGSSPKKNNRLNEPVVEQTEVDKAYVSEKGVKFILAPKRGMATDGLTSVAIPLTKKGQTNWTGSFVSPDIDHIERSTTIGNEEPTQIVLKNGERMTSNDDTSHLRIRKLTPLECWRLMDFDDEDFYKAQAIESNTQLYAQAGNSIVVNCLVAIFGQMFEGKENVYAERFGKRRENAKTNKEEP